MIHTPDHIINREIFEFTYSETEKALALQGQMNSGLQYKMQTVINNVLDECCDESITARLERLEIDLGEIPFESLENLLPQKLYTAFRDELGNVIAESNSYQGKKSLNEAGENTDDILELLEVFFLTGSLPWWLSQRNGFSISQIVNYLIQNAPGRVKAFVYKNIANTQFTDRLVFQLNIETCERLLMLLLASKNQISFVENIVNTASPRIVQDCFPRTDNNETVFFGKLSAFPGIDFKKKIISVLFRLIAQVAISYSKDEMQFLLKTIILDVFKDHVEPRKIYEVLKEQSEKHFYADIITIKDEMETVKESAGETFSSKHGIAGSKSEKFYIQNAGLLLIATFLPAIFKELYGLEDKHFVNKEIQHRALFLLHYICTGQDEAPEYTLQLNKILCGLDLEEPIPFSVSLTDAEKREADLLLHDIITNWKALKNSSLEALRGSFLLRDGLLSFADDYWLLQVERKGYDVLIDHLPWSFKTIKFDWMDNYINTEW
ncbi:MAG TPA: contractile injection system tape measure protein [Flavisolibacter sp.]|jgi:hypothetical protein|nr:contractile injection system tape measure protein [Flavisolibacter sp.]